MLKGKTTQAASPSVMFVFFLWKPWFLLLSCLQQRIIKKIRRPHLEKNSTASRRRGEDPPQDAGQSPACCIAVASLASPRFNNIPPWQRLEGKWSWWNSSFSSAFGSSFYTSNGVKWCKWTGMISEKCLDFLWAASALKRPLFSSRQQGSMCETLK